MERPIGLFYQVYFKGFQSYFFELVFESWLSFLACEHVLQINLDVSQRLSSLSLTLLGLTTQVEGLSS